MEKYVLIPFNGGFMKRRVVSTDLPVVHNDTPQIYEQPAVGYKNISNDNSLVIHWFVSPRTTLTLTPMEQFHTQHIRMYKFTEVFVDSVVCISIDDTNNTTLIDFIKSTLIDIIPNPTFIVTQNNRNLGEFNTYYNHVFKQLKTDKKIFYMHFKGVSKENNPHRFQVEKIWCENLYKGCFTGRILDTKDIVCIAGAHLETKDRYWFQRWLWLNLEVPYANRYPFFKNMNTSVSFLDGTFQWVNTKNMRGYIERFCSIDEFLNINFKLYAIRYTHFSEYFLCSILVKNEMLANFDNQIRTWVL